MKRKYFAAAMLLVATSSCGLAYQLAQAAERDIQMARASQDSQLQLSNSRMPANCESPKRQRYCSPGLL